MRDDIATHSLIKKQCVVMLGWICCNMSYNNEKYQSYNIVLNRGIAGNKRNIREMLQLLL